MIRPSSRLAWWLALVIFGSPAVARSAVLWGEIRESGKLVPARLYVQDAAGGWHFARSAHPDGTAVRYEKQARANPASVEMHTTLSAHPFEVDVPPGVYTITIERGPEYHATRETVTVPPSGRTNEFQIQRWINLAERGWYSGDTHVHRTLDELPNVMLAEDLNVAFPLVYWVTQAFKAPTAGDKNLGGRVPEGLIKVDDTHVIWPRNTEYELFTVNGKRHTLGAVFAINHKSVFELGAPPVGPIAAQARREGALLELDKHNWPWSMMLVPVMNVDLFELSNNHVWRTAFGFRNFGLDAPAYMKLSKIGKWTEADWLSYGFQNYYALLNCGFRLRPTAGTANGVHPVPLGFGRVYVHCPDGFSYERWVEGLNAGRSFVTTGPMLFATVNGKPPGHVFQLPEGGLEVEISGTCERPIFPEYGLGSDDWPEVILNGDSVIRVAAGAIANGGNLFVYPKHRIQITQTGWMAIRWMVRRSDGRVRFAHTGVWHFEVPGKPLRPKREEVEFLVSRIRDELARNEGVLPGPALAEYREALRRYEALRANAR